MVLIFVEQTSHRYFLMLLLVLILKVWIISMQLSYKLVLCIFFKQYLSENIDKQKVFKVMSFIKIQFNYPLNDTRAINEYRLKLASRL